MCDNVATKLPCGRQMTQFSERRLLASLSMDLDPLPHRSHRDATAGISQTAGADEGFFNYAGLAFANRPKLTPRTESEPAGSTRRIFRSRRAKTVSTGLAKLVCSVNVD